MRRIISSAAAFLLLAVPFAGTAEPARNTVFTPKGQIRNFTVVIPPETKVTFSDGKDETTYSMKYRNARMRIRAIKTDTPDLLSQIQNRKWELRDMDPSIRIIIEGDKVTVRKSVEGALLICQYRDREKKRSVIQRTLVAGKGSYVYIIDCTASVSDFYSYEKMFTLLMGSFAMTQGEADETPENGPSDKQQTKPDIQISPDDFQGLEESEGGNMKQSDTITNPSGGNAPAQPETDREKKSE